MENRSYIKPELMKEELIPNQYVATCYIVNCNVPSANELWLENNKEEGLQREGPNKDNCVYTSSRGFRGCDKKHKGVYIDPIKNGYYYKYYSNGNYGQVFIWSEDLGSDSDYHASLLNANDVSTNANAS